MTLKSFKQITESYVYHRTDGKNINQIKQQGLKSGSKENYNFFSSNIEGTSNYGGNKSVLLRLHRKHLPKHETDYDGVIYAHGNIPNKHLEMQTKSGWKKL